MKATHYSSTAIHLLGLLLLVLSAGANAQEDNFDNLFFDDPLDITSELPLNEEPLSDAAAYVTVITAEMIDAFGYRTIGELLSAQAGFYVSDDGPRSYIGVRGLASPGEFNSRILFMVNDQRLNDGALDAWLSSDAAPIDIRSIERIEIIRGPGASAYGANAWAGVLNVVTKSGRARGGLEIFASMDDHRRQVTSVAYGNRWRNGLELDASLRILRDDGPEAVFVPAFNTPQTNNGIAEELLSKNGETLLLTASWGDFNVQYGRADYTNNSPIAPFFSSFNDPDTRFDDDIAFAMIEWRRILRNGVDARIRVHEVSTGTDFYTPRTFPVNGFPVRIVAAGLVDTRTRTLEADISQTFGIHKLTAGLFRSDKSPMTSTTLVDDIVVDRPEESRSFDSVFLEDQIRLTKNSRAIIGMRVDKKTQARSVLNPRLAWIQELGKDLDLKLLIGSASRVPNWAEDSNAFARPASESTLIKEDIHTTEIQLASDSRGNEWHVSVYRYRFNNLITPLAALPGTGPRYANSPDDFSSYGIEFDRRFELRYVDLSANVSWSNSQNDTTKARALYAPRVMANLRLSNWRITPSLSAAVEARFRGSQLSYLRNRVGSALQVFASLRWQPPAVEGLSVDLRIRNATDRDVFDPVAPYHQTDTLRQPSRTIGIDLTWRL
ncbi:MAG: TonB-dependent receptor plug domain-containing protein [Pseudomonadota bacterium]